MRRYEKGWSQGNFGSLAFLKSAIAEKILRVGLLVVTIFSVGSRIFTVQCTLRKSETAVRYGIASQEGSHGSDKFYFFGCV